MTNLNEIPHEELMLFIQLKIKLALGDARWKNVLDLVEETIDDVFKTVNYSAAYSIKDSSFSFLEDTIANMVHRGVFDKPIIQHFEHRSRSDAFMEALICRIIKKPGFVAPVAALIKQHATNAIDEEFKSE